MARRQEHHVAAVQRLQQGTDFRAEQIAAALADQIQRLDPERVARRQELSGGRLDGDEGVHADQPRDRAVAPDPKRIGQHLAVGRGAKAHPQRFQLNPQRRVVVDFAVEGHHDAVVEGRHRLDRVNGVDDAEPAGAHGGARHRLDDRIGDVAAVKDGAEHAADQGARLQAPVDRNRHATHDPSHPNPDCRSDATEAAPPQRRGVRTTA